MQTEHDFSTIEKIDLKKEILNYIEREIPKDEIIKLLRHKTNDEILKTESLKEMLENAYSELQEKKPDYLNYNSFQFSDFQYIDQDKIQKTKSKLPGEKINIYRLADFDINLKNSCARDTADYSLIFSKKFENDDIFGVAVLDYCRTYYNQKLSEVDLKNLIIYISYKNKFNSILKLFERLEPCYENPLQKLLLFINFRHENKIVIFEIFNLFFLKMFLKLYANEKKINYVNDVTPVLIGNQGIGKSLLCKFLAISDDFFTELSSQNGEINSKDNLLHIRKKIIVELSELAAFKKSEIESIKTFLTLAFDSYRPPYAKSEIKIPRTANFIGSTNKDEFLKDTTGNRRFYPVEIESIDFEIFKRKDLIYKLYAYYSELAKKIISEKQDLFQFNIISKECQEYLQEIRQDARIKMNYEDDILSWLDNKILKWKTENQFKTEKLPLFLNVNECKRSLFPNLSYIPLDFNNTFSVILKENGFLNKRKREKINGQSRSIHVWYNPNLTHDVTDVTSVPPLFKNNINENNKVIETVGIAGNTGNNLKFDD